MIFFKSILSKNYKDFYANDKGNYISKLINEVTLIDEKFFSNLCTFLQVSIKASLVLISIFFIELEIIDNSNIFNDFTSLYSKANTK